MFLYFCNEKGEFDVQKRMTSDVVLECTYTPRSDYMRRCGVSLAGANEKRNTEKQWFWVRTSYQRREW